MQAQVIQRGVRASPLPPPPSATLVRHRGQCRASEWTTGFPGSGVASGALSVQWGAQEVAWGRTWGLSCSAVLLGCTREELAVPLPSAGHTAPSPAQLRPGAGIWHRGFGAAWDTCRPHQSARFRSLLHFGLQLPAANVRPGRQRQWLQCLAPCPLGERTESWLPGCLAQPGCPGHLGEAVDRTLPAFQISRS